MISTMTFCNNLANKEKIGVPSFIICTDSVFDAYLTRISNDSGTNESLICLRDYINKIINDKI